MAAAAHKQAVSIGRFKIQAVAASQKKSKGHPHYAVYVQNKVQKHPYNAL